MIEIHDIIMENARTFAERREISSLTENQIAKINNVMISNLYKTAIEKSHIDFEDIPESKGDITRYSGYKTMSQVIAIFKEISDGSNTLKDAVTTVELAINNIIANREAFEKGFKLNKEFIILLYNTLVYACVESISVILSSYIDFVVHPDKVEFEIIKAPSNPGWLSLGNLKKFNQSVNTGDFQRSMKQIISSGRENLAGAVTIPLIVIGGFVALVGVMRELTFYFYYSRMKLAEYLEQQATFLELHQDNMMNDRRLFITRKPLTIEEKKKIEEKQNKRIKTLRDIAKRIQVNTVRAGKDATDNLKVQNKKWTFNEVKNQSLNNDIGFQII